MELKEMRENVGLRQADVAKKLRVSIPAVSNWENGVNGIASKNIKPLSKLYGVPESEIKAIADAIRAINQEGA